MRVGGTLGQSLKALRYDGTVAVVGFSSGEEGKSGPALMEILL
jgi:NADPH:quinone reductase-like Zn-dependent oxidoreductase